MPSQPVIMRVTPVNYSLPDNLEHRVYYQPLERGFSPCAWLGLFQDGAVVAVGRVEAVCQLIFRDQETLDVISEGRLSAPQTARVTAAYLSYLDHHCGGVARDMWFLLVDRFHPTRYVKESPGALRRAKLLDLAALLPGIPLTSGKAVATALRQLTW